MGLTSLFLEVENRNVFILGTGEVATRRAHRFLDKGANVILAGNSIDEELTKKGAILTPLKDLDAIIASRIVRSCHHECARIIVVIHQLS